MSVARMLDGFSTFSCLWGLPCLPASWWCAFGSFGVIAECPSHAFACVSDLKRSSRHYRSLWLSAPVVLWGRALLTDGGRRALSTQ